MSNEPDGLYDLLVERLEQSDLADEAKLLVLAAFEGRAELAQALEQPAERQQQRVETVARAEPVSAYLSGISARDSAASAPRRRSA